MRIILIHGFNAEPSDNFHPWLAEKLRSDGHEVVCPNLDISSKIEVDLPAIMDSLKSQIGYLNGNDILLGHSLSSFIILQYLEAVEMKETPRAVVMVGTPWKVSKPELRRLFLADLDADVLMWKAREYVVIHSKDDAMVPFSHAEKLSVAFKAKLVETNGQGHFMGREYPVLHETVTDIISRPFEYAPGIGLEDAYAEEEIEL